MARMRRWIALGLAAVAVVTAADNVDDARAQLLAGHVDAAIELLRGLVAKDPSAVEPSVLLAETLLAEERFDEAEEAVEAALNKHPSGRPAMPSGRSPLSGRADLRCR
jgi:cytochrome c-type biogenesis protein CcmH/NrfG